MFDNATYAERLIAMRKAEIETETLRYLVDRLHKNFAAMNEREIIGTMGAIKLSMDNIKRLLRKAGVKA